MDMVAINKFYQFQKEEVAKLHDKVLREEMLLVLKKIYLEFDPEKAYKEIMEENNGS